MKSRYSRFDIRHKETLTLFFKEYVELFFPDLADRIEFETAQFLDKELIALFEKPEKKDEKEDINRITDALILIDIIMDGKPEQILVYWEQQSEKQKDFEKRMFHCFCGIYFKFQKPVFPVAMFTDSAKWRKPVEHSFTMSLFKHVVAEFNYHLIKLKNYKAEDFEKKAGENPLAAAYLPLTDYPKKARPEIKAKALNRVAHVEPGPRRSVLVSLIEHCIRLTPDEKIRFRELVLKNPMYKEVNMLQSVEEVYEEIGMDRGMEKGMEEGRKEGRKESRKETAIKMLRAGWLKKEQISEFTDLDMAEIDELEKSLAAENK